MNATMQKLLKGASITVELVSSRYGTAPTMRVTMPKTCSYRKTYAVVHTLAAEIELSIPARETWQVTIEHKGEHTGTIAIELVKGTPDEAERAMAVLYRAVQA